MTDPQGRNPKRRPAVIITPTDQILASGTFDVAAVTTQIGESPREFSVALPWHRDGHPRTKLNRANEAVACWLTTIQESDVIDYGGIVPFVPLRDLLLAVERWIASQSIPPNESASM